MALLRAGPFTGGGSFFQPEPSTPSDSSIPVNCANFTNSNAWPWMYNKRFEETLISHTGCAVDPGSGEDIPTTSTSSNNNLSLVTITGSFSESNSVSSNHEVKLEQNLKFAYQATHSFDIRVGFNITASGDSTLNQSGSMGFLDSFIVDTGPILGFPSVSGSITRTLPASSLPTIYYAEIFSNGARIDFPDDVCTPQTSQVSLSAEITIEFL